MQNLLKKKPIKSPFKAKQNPDVYHQKHLYYLVSFAVLTLFPCICPIKRDVSLAGLLSGELPSPRSGFMAGSWAQVEPPSLLGKQVLCHRNRLHRAIAVTALIPTFCP